LTDLYDREEQREAIDPVSKEEEAKNIVGKSPEESGV